MNVKYLPKVKKYINIKPELYNILHKKVSELYYGISDGLADGIAIEYGETIYIIDSGKNNGILDFGVREKLIIEDESLRKEYIRDKNDDSISKGHVDDELSEKLRNRLSNNRTSDRRQDEGLQLPITQRESRHNEIGISSKNEEATKRIKYSLKDSDAKNANSYTKAEAVEMVDGIMESLLSFEWGYGELKNRVGVLLNYFNENTDWFDSQSVNFLLDFIQ